MCYSVTSLLPPVRHVRGAAHLHDDHQGAEEAGRRHGLRPGQGTHLQMGTLRRTRESSREPRERAAGKILGGQRRKSIELFGALILLWALPFLLCLVVMYNYHRLPSIVWLPGMIAILHKAIKMTERTSK